MKRLILLIAFLLTVGNAYASPLGNGPSTIDLSGSYNLQEVTDTVFGTGAIDVQNDQSGVGGWTQSENDATAFRVISQFPDSGVTALVGIYDLSGGNEYTLMNLASDNSSNFVIFNGDLYVNNVVVSSGWSKNFGFFTKYDTDPKRYTEDSKNGGVNFSATYLINDGQSWDTSAYSSSGITAGTMKGNDDWLVAMESDGGFRDFQDVVFMVEDIAPVPEPGTLLLLGSGLLGLAFMKRRKA